MKMQDNFNRSPKPPYWTYITCVLFFHLSVVLFSQFSYMEAYQSRDGFRAINGFFSIVEPAPSGLKELAA